jgi:spore maturation protein CgeB
MRWFILIPYGDLGHCKMQDCKDGLLELGHEVETFRLMKGEESRPGGSFSAARLRFLAGRLKRFRPDFILASEHRGVSNELFGKMGIPYASWFTADPTYWLKEDWISPYCCIFLWDSFYVRELRASGFKKVFYLPLATNRNTFRPIDLTSDEKKMFGCDISFVGSSGYQFYNEASKGLEKVDPDLLSVLREVVRRRSEDPLADLQTLIDEARTKSSRQIVVSDLKNFQMIVNFLANPLYRKKLIETLLPFDLRIYGDSGWIQFLNCKGKFFGRIEDRRDLAKLYNATKINLNMTDSTLKETLPVRIYDIFSCRSFLLTDYRPDLDRLFAFEGIREICYKGRRELLEKVRYFLNHTNERCEISRKGYESVLSSHTYTHRMELMVRIMKEVF